MAVPPLRADARRNRLAIVEAAAAVFAEQGLDAGVAEVARRAGVGPATLFRHFPTKQDLVGAILDQRAGQVLEMADRALARAEEDPEGALVQFLEEGTQVHLRDRGFLQAAVTDGAAAEHVEKVRLEFDAKVGELLRRGQEAGVWRADLVPDDLPMAMAGCAGACLKFAEAQPGIERRYLQLIVDGMRCGPHTGALCGPAPSLDAVIAARGQAACAAPPGPSAADPTDATASAR
jgi:AcrR family transcriptional regulator